MQLTSCPSCGSRSIETDIPASPLAAGAAAVFTLLTFGFGSFVFWFVSKENICRACATRWRVPTEPPWRRLARRLRTQLRYRMPAGLPATARRAATALLVPQPGSWHGGAIVFDLVDAWNRFYFDLEQMSSRINRFLHVRPRTP